MRRKVALISGSTRGIGLGIAKKLLSSNYIVYINGRDKDELQRLSSELKGKVKAINLDLNKEKNISKALDEIILKEKKIDLIVANIGSGKSISGWDIQVEEYKRIFDINFFNAVSLATQATSFMKKKGGHIIFISSIAGCESIGAPITYTAAKTALLSFAKSLSNEVAKYNIRVNSISPGNVMFEGSTWDEKIKNDKEFVTEYIKNNVPLNNFAIPEDIAKAVEFLENSSFMTGTNIIVDGGQLNKII